MKVHFPNLNAIRFIAALLVIVHHIEQFKEVFSLQNVFHNHTIQLMSKIGVILFFVLSGFLITYLLLVEQKENSTIDIKAFYIRRILRIWPLYFLIILLAFFIFPHIVFMYIPGHSNTHWLIKIMFFIFFMPNIIQALGGGVAYANQAWSIGAEEQFYLIWPLLMKFVKNKLVLLLSIIFIYLVIRCAFWLFSYSAVGLTLFRIWDLFCIDCMAIGGLFALIHFNNYTKAIRILRWPGIQIFTWLITIIFIGAGNSLGFFHYEIYAILFGIIIYNLAVNPNSIIKFKIKILDYLGKISYGIYMYHPIGIVITIKILMLFNVVNNLFIYIGSFLFTISIAYLSYNFFEKKFIKLKLKFSKIMSGDNVLT